MVGEAHVCFSDCAGGVAGAQGPADCEGSHPATVERGAVWAQGPQVLCQGGGVRRETTDLRLRGPLPPFCFVPPSATARAGLQGGSGASCGSVAVCWSPPPQPGRGRLAETWGKALA